MNEEQLRAATIGDPRVLDRPVVLAEHDPEWPKRFEDEAAKIRGALGERALQLEHVGSTSVPGLAAKPIIDVLLVVLDSADEASYVPALEEAGYVLRIREPEWYEHRLLKTPEWDVNVHVFSPGAHEVTRMLAFRDHLRTHRADRERYERTKRELAQRRWKYQQDYADAKTQVVEEILERAFSV